MDVGQDPPQDFFLLLGFVRDFFSMHDLDFFILFPGTGKDFFLYCCFRIFFSKEGFSGFMVQDRLGFSQDFSIVFPPLPPPPEYHDGIYLKRPGSFRIVQDLFFFAGRLI